MTLVDNLRQAIDETEQVAKSASGWSASGRTWRRDLVSCVEDGDGRLIVYGEGTPTSAQADHIARHDPAAVLRRCAADRKILDLHAPWSPDLNGSPRCQVCHGDGTYSGSGPCDTLVLIAEAYGVEEQA